MRILLASNTCLDHGGISMFMLQWLRGIKEVDKESSVTVYFRHEVSSVDVEKAFKDLGAHICNGTLPIGMSFKNYNANKKMLDEIDKILENGRFDVVHINSRFFAFHVLLLKEAKRYGVPIRISHFHGSLEEPLGDKIVHSYFKHRIRSLATTYASCSCVGADYLFGKRGVKSSKWQMVPNTIQVSRFEFNEQKRVYYRDALEISDEVILLGTVGRLEKEKNHVFLINLMEELRSYENHVKLIIIGDGNEKSDLQKKCSKSNIAEHVIFYGTTDDVPGLLSAMDYFLMPSISEGFPISSVEAQANGLVCLLSNRITREVDLGCGVFYIPIDNGPKPWIDVIRDNPPIKLNSRKKGAETVRNAGFDEKDTGKYVKRLYKTITWNTKS